jgi:hypothetical protein
MLGIMNCNDAVDFYSVNPDKQQSSQKMSGLKQFFGRVSQRRRSQPKLSYTKDGRRLVDGRPMKKEDNNAPDQLWSSL